MAGCVRVWMGGWIDEGIDRCIGVWMVHRWMDGQVNQSDHEC